MIPDAFESGQVVDQARKLNPTLPIIARSHSEAESAHLRKFGVDRAILGEQEVARAMVKAIPQVEPRAADPLAGTPDPGAVDDHTGSRTVRLRRAEPGNVESGRLQRYHMSRATRASSDMRL